MPGFFGMLTAVITDVSQSSIDTDAQGRYLRLVSSPLFQRSFAGHIAQALQATLSGTITAERGWGLIYAQLIGVICEMGRVAGNVSDLADEPPSKKKRKSEGGAQPSPTVSGPVRDAAVALALLSRIHHILAASAKARNGGELVGDEGMLNMLAEQGQLCLLALPCKGGPGKLPWAQDILFAAHVRVRTDLASLGYNIESSPSLSVSLEQNELCYESARWLAEVEQDLTTHVDQYLSVLQDDSAASWSGRLGDLKSESKSAALWNLLARESLQQWE